MSALLIAAMDALLSPLFVSSRVRFVPLRPPTFIGPYVPPDGVLFPVEASAQPQSDGGYSPEELAGGAVYVICYRPLHADAVAFRQLARAYMQAGDPGFPARLVSEARGALSEGDWVGTIGRLWTAVQLDPSTPEALDELAAGCLHFAFATSARGDHPLSARLVKAAGGALNTLHDRFPTFASGHYRRAEFLAAAGDHAGAFLALREALRLGLSADLEEAAREMVRGMVGLPERENLEL